MIKNNQSTKTKTLIILITAVILIFTYFFIARPIISRIESGRFEQLENDMKALKSKLDQVAKVDEEVIFEKTCDEQLSGDWPTGEFYCLSSLTMQKHINSADELADIQSRYFPLIDSASFLDGNGELMINPIEKFGKELVVSSAEKKYTNGSMECTLLNKLYKDDSSHDIKLYGDQVGVDEGKVVLSLECGKLTKNSWYED